MAKPTPPLCIPVAMGCGASQTKVEKTTGSESKDAATTDDSKAKTELGKSKTAGELMGKDKDQEDIRDKYDLGQILGSGSFGQVREAKLKDSPTEVRAVKMIEPDKGDGEWSNQAIFVREVGLLQQMQHENIIRYYDFYEDFSFLYVVMELCKGGEVFAKIVELKRFSEKNAALIGQQMLKALDYIHKLHIAHRDIKAENFMLSDVSIHSNVKMIDFGMATKFKPDQVLTELCGSPHYLSPELIGQKYNHLADVWAFGVLLYLLLYGHYPYDAKHPRDIMVKILTEPIKWQSKAKLSKDAIKFLTGLLVHDINKRLTAEGALEHPWMKKGNTIGSDEGQILNPEILRSAHKKVTGTKKVLEPMIDASRNEKLQKIAEDFNVGIRHGKRLGATPKEDYMSKPEFIRRENKITTAPSRDMNVRRESFAKMLNMFGRGRSGSQVAIGTLEICQEKILAEQIRIIAPDANKDSIKEEQKDSERSGGLAAIGESKVLQAKVGTLQGGDAAKTSTSSPPGMNAPRRLSYLVGITPQDEKSFEILFKEKNNQGSVDTKALTPLMPTSEAGETPGEIPDDESDA